MGIYYQRVLGSACLCLCRNFVGAYNIDHAHNHLLDVPHCPACHIFMLCNIHGKSSQVTALMTLPNMVLGGCSHAHFDPPTGPACRPENAQNGAYLILNDVHCSHQGMMLPGKAIVRPTDSHQFKTMVSTPFRVLQNRLKISLRRRGTAS